MNASETVWACIAVAIGLLVVATTGFNRWHKPRTDRRFQRTARKAARTEADVRNDIAAVKARQAQIQARFDEQFEQIIAGYPHDIPHQRTEEP